MPHANERRWNEPRRFRYLENDRIWHHVFVLKKLRAPGSTLSPCKREVAGSSPVGWLRLIVAQLVERLNTDFRLVFAVSQDWLTGESPRKIVINIGP